MSDSKLVQLTTKQFYVNEQLVKDLEYQLKLAKEGRITLLAMMSYCAAEEGRWFSYIERGGFCSVTDCFIFTESLQRQVYRSRDLADDVREEQNG